MGFHMAAEVDARTNEMTFLYRFLPGLCPASHGHNVARLAGLPDTLLHAQAKSTEFEQGTVDATIVDGTVKAELARLAEVGDTNGLRALYQRHFQKNAP